VNLSNRDSRFWLIAGAVVALLVLAIGWEFFISPERDSAASLRSEAANAQVQNATTATQVAKLARLDQNKAQLVDQLQEALDGLPSDSGLSDFTDQVNAQARAHHVTLSSVAVGGFTVPAAPVAADTSAGTDTSGSDTTAAAGDTTDPAAAAPAATGGLPANVVSISVTLISTGSASDQLAFLHDLRVAGPRRALVTATQMGVPATAGTVSVDGSSTMTVQLTVFSAVRTAAERAEFAKLLQG
jgi:hypothetical protein